MKTYFKYVLSVRGMRCGMCEVHIEELISRNFDVKKVDAKRNKKQVIILSSSPLDEDKLKTVMDSSGYPYLGIIEQSIVTKKSLFERFFKRK